MKVFVPFTFPIGGQRKEGKRKSNCCRDTPSEDYTRLRRRIYHAYESFVRAGHPGHPGSPAHSGSVRWQWWRDRLGQRHPVLPKRHGRSPGKTARRLDPAVWGRSGSRGCVGLLLRVPAPGRDLGRHGFPDRDRGLLVALRRGWRGRLLRCRGRELCP